MLKQQEFLREIVSNLSSILCNFNYNIYYIDLEDTVLPTIKVYFFSGFYYEIDGLELYDLYNELIVQEEPDVLSTIIKDIIGNIECIYYSIKRRAYVNYR